MARLALPTPRNLRATLCWALGVVVAGCDGSFVSLGVTGDPLSDATAGSATFGGGGLGAGASEAWRVSAAPLIARADALNLANPTLTANQQQLYYTQQLHGGSPDPHRVLLMHTTREDDHFGVATEVSLTDDTFGVAGPAISPFGDELWFSRLSSKGDTDIWHSTAEDDAWSAPELVSTLSSTFDDMARPPGAEGTLMPLSSKRHGGTLFQIYLSARAPDGSWGTPNQAHLAGVNHAGSLNADGFLSRDGRALFFASTRSGNADIYVARRPTLDDDFGEPARLGGDLNSDYEERMPWVSADERTLYFASNRPGDYDQYGIYVAQRLAP